MIRDSGKQASDEQPFVASAGYGEWKGGEMDERQTPVEQDAFGVDPPLDNFEEDLVDAFEQGALTTTEFDGETEKAIQFP